MSGSSAGGISNSLNFFGHTQRISCDSKAKISPHQRRQMNNGIRRWKFSYWWLAKLRGARQAPFVSIFNSSLSSLISACSGVSPRSIFPPGNSQRPAISLPLGRFVIKTLPSASTRAPATTITMGFV